MADNNLQLDDLKIKISVDPEQAKRGIKTIADALDAMAKGSSKTAQAIRNITAQLDDMGEKSVEASTKTEESAEKTSSALARIGEYAKRAATGGVSLLAKGLTAPFRLAGNVIQGVVGKITTLWQAIKRVAFYRLIRTAIKEVTQALREGITLLVEWDRVYGNNTSRAAQTTDELAAKWREVKKSLGAAAMPLIQIVQPALEAIMQSVINLANVANQTLRSLQGYSTYIKATDKGFKSAVGSAKELKRILFGFDELNVLPSANGGGAAAEVGAIDFEEVDIEKTFNLQAFARIGQFIDDVKGRWSNFVANVQSGGSFIWSWYELVAGVFQDFGILVADIFRGAGDLINSFVGKLGLDGTAIGEVISSIGDMFIHVGDIIEGIVTLDFPKIATGLTDLFTDAVRIVDGGLWEVGELVNTALSWLEEKLGVDFSDIKGLVGLLITGIRGLLGIGLPTIFGTVVGWISDIWNFIKGAAQGIIQVFQGIIDFLWGSFTGDWKMAWNALADMFKGIVNIFISVVELMANAFITPLQSVANAINNFRISIPDWVPLIGGKSWNPQISVPQKISIPRLAEGGFVPNTGSLYYAGEDGSELVANMRGGTGVMNVEQFETAMTNANTEVVNAVYAMANLIVGAVNNKNLDVILDGRKVGQSVTQYQLGYSKQYGG